MGPKAQMKNTQAPTQQSSHSLPHTHLILTHAPLTVEGEASKGSCEPIHTEHGTNGHIGHGLHSALGHPEGQRSWNCHIQIPALG